jgi:23S rRNA (pseudouridine1915-N3)-methyltransferase
MGRIVVHCHGKTSDRNLNTAIQVYLERLKAKVTLKEHSDKTSPEAYLAAIPAEAILLDEGGMMISSIELANRFRLWTLERDDIHLAIGPADGFPKTSGRDKISLSMMTLPHELATLVLIEQLYRAYEINRGSSYHRP